MHRDHHAGTATRRVYLITFYPVDHETEGSPSWSRKYWACDFMHAREQAYEDAITQLFLQDEEPVDVQPLECVPLGHEETVEYAYLCALVINCSR